MRAREKVKESNGMEEERDKKKRKRGERVRQADRHAGRQTDKQASK